MSKKLYCRQERNLIIMGKDVVFAWFPKGEWQLADETTDTYIFTIYTPRDVTI